MRRCRDRSREPAPEQLLCPHHRHSRLPLEDSDGHRDFVCAAPGCRVVVRIDRGSPTEIDVSGDNASDVQAVTRQLAEDVAARREAARLRRSPWFSGLFYLTAVVVIVSLLLVVGRIVSWWVFPLIIVCAVFLVVVVGALQMRQDDRLSERGFLRLMGDVLRRLPLLVSRSGRPEDLGSNSVGRDPESGSR